MNIYSIIHKIKLFWVYRDQVSHSFYVGYSYDMILEWSADANHPLGAIRRRRTDKA